jgi:hypothetical protein
MELYKFYEFPWVVALETNQQGKWDLELEMLWVSFHVSLQCIYSGILRGFCWELFHKPSVK